MSAGTRTSCAIRDTNDDTNEIDARQYDTTLSTIICWGSRANTLLDHFAVEEDKDSSYREHHQISLGQDHACATANVKNESAQSTESSMKRPSLECYWMAGSNFEAHRIPVGLEMVG